MLCIRHDFRGDADCAERAARIFDFAECYLRNYISRLQFLVTPEFEAYYRERNKNAGEAKLQAGLKELRKFQGGIIGGSGLNDYENELLGAFLDLRCSAAAHPEGMRAIHTAWINTIDHYQKSPLGPEGVYVNSSFSRDSKWGRVVSFMPEAGRLTVKSAVNDVFFSVRPIGRRVKRYAPLSGKTRSSEMVGRLRALRCPAWRRADDHLSSRGIYP